MVGPISTSTAIGMSLSLMHSMDGGQARGQEDKRTRRRASRTRAMRTLEQANTGRSWPHLRHRPAIKVSQYRVVSAFRVSRK